MSSRNSVQSTRTRSASKGRRFALRVCAQLGLNQPAQPLYLTSESTSEMADTPRIMVGRYSSLLRTCRTSEFVTSLICCERSIRAAMKEHIVAFGCRPVKLVDEHPLAELLKICPRPNLKGAWVTEKARNIMFGLFKVSGLNVCLKAVQ